MGERQVYIIWASTKIRMSKTIRTDGYDQDQGLQWLECNTQAFTVLVSCST